MIFDDHDVHDDWNISGAWVERDAGDAVVGRAHHGCLHVVLALPAPRQSVPPELAEEALLAPDLRRTRTAVRGSASSPAHADREPAASRLAFYRDFGRSRLLVIDSRAARVLADGRRDMVDDEEWDWIAEHARGAFDHLVIASTLPVFMTPGIARPRGLERSGLLRRLGPLAARVGEKLRRALDLEHWPAFQRSFRTMVELLHELWRKARDAPGTISFIGGDVHTAYVAEVALGGRRRVVSSRSSARPSGIRSSRASGAPSGSSAHDFPAPCVARWHEVPVCVNPMSAGSS